MELISQMKPKASNEHEEGLLEYLEDIIGTAHYAEKIEEAAKQLDQANIECSEKVVRVRHAEKEMTSLQVPLESTVLTSSSRPRKIKPSSF